MNLKSFDKRTVAAVRRELLSAARSHEKNADWNDRAAREFADASYSRQATHDRLEAQLLRALADGLMKSKERSRK